MGKKSRNKQKSRFVVEAEGQEQENLEQEEKQDSGYSAFSAIKEIGFYSQLEKVCLGIIQAATYLVLFAPLLVMRSSFFPFVTPKTIFFNILVEVMVAAYLVLIIYHKQWRPKITPLMVSIALFMGVFALTSFTGVNFERSFWSTHERMTGLFTMLHLFGFFVVLSSVFKKREDWERILGVSIFAGILLAFNVLSGSGSSTRGGGTIGNTSFMAAYLLFNVFFAIILLLTKKIKWQIYAGISLLITIPTVLMSSCRAGVGAFWVGLFLMGIGYMIFSRKKMLKRIAFGIILAIMVFGSVCAIVQPSFVQGGVDSLMHEMNPRFTVWNMAWQGWQDKFLLGWGPENFNVVFNQNFNPCLFMTECGGEIWFDRAHNIIFDMGVGSGIIGIIAYLGIFGIAIFSLLKLCPRIAGTRDVFIPLGMVIILLAYFFQNLFVFDMINTYLMFFLCLAFIAFLTKKEEVSVERSEIPQAYGKEGKELGESAKQVLTGIAIVSMLFVFWYGSLKSAQGAGNIVNMLSSQLVKDANVYFDKTLNTWMNKYETREHFAMQITKYSSDTRQDREEVVKGFEVAEKEMRKSVELNPLDFRPHLFLGKLYNNSYFFNQDDEKIKFGEDVLLKAIELSPTNQQGYWYMAEFKLIQRKIDDAIDLLQTAIALEPRLARSHWYQAMAYKFDGQNEKALEKIKDAEERGYGWKKNVGDLKKVIDVYVALKKDVELVELLQLAIDFEPNNTQFLASLVATYANMGEFDKARETALKMSEIDPLLAPKVEEFLKTLPSK